MRTPEKPTKKVMASAFAPTACTYAGIVPRAKQDAPTTKNQAMAEFRRAGSMRACYLRVPNARSSSLPVWTIHRKSMLSVEKRA